MRVRIVILCFIFLMTSGMAPTVYAAPPQQDVPDQIAVIQVAAPTYSDNFRRESDAWYTGEDEDAAHFFESGTYHIRVDAKSLLSWSLGDVTDLADFYLEVDAFYVAGPQNNESGVIFRHLDDDNFYLFGVGNDGLFSLRKKVDGEWQDLQEWLESDAILGEERSVNTLGILAQGEQIHLLINDEVVASVTDDQFSSGNMGLAAGAFDEGGVEIAFDDLRIWTIGEGRDVPDLTTPEPDATPELDPTPEPIDVTDRLTEIRDTDVTFSDEFRRDNGEWFTESDDDVAYEYAGRTLHIIVNSENRLGWTFNSTIDELAPVDYLVEVDVEQVAGPDDAELGLIFRFVDEENFYFFAVSNLGNYSLWKLVDNEWEALLDWTETDALQTDAEAINRLSVLTEGSQITLLANDVALAQVEDDTFATGTVGLMVGTFDEIGVDVAFDNLDLWVLTTAEDVLETPVATPTPVAEPVDVTDRLAEIKADDPTTSDDFRRDNDTWNLEPDEDATFFYRGRTFHIKVDAPEWIGWSAGEITTTDFLLEVDTQYVDGPADAEYGVIFRQVDADNYYFFAISRSGSYRLWRLEDGEWSTMVEWTQTDAIDISEDALNRLGVLAEGAQLTLLVNDVALTQLEDETFASGKVALALGTFEEAGAEVAFDNLDIWAIE